MKQTLMITILAAALLGGQIFAAESRTYKLSEYRETSRITSLDVAYSAKIVIDTQQKVQRVQCSGSLTLDYQGNFYLTASNDIDFSALTLCDITASVDTASSWEKFFSNSEGNLITLAYAEDEEIYSNGATQYQFFGQNEGDKVKLGNAEVVFKGVVADLSHLQANEVGLLISSNDLKLAGVINQSVPEPTTGFLSLLALAGLCSRRRKK